MQNTPQKHLQSNALKLHAHFVRMQSNALQSSALHRGLRGYRRGKARSLRSRAFGLGTSGRGPSALGTSGRGPSALGTSGRGPAAWEHLVAAVPLVL